MLYCNSQQSRSKNVAGSEPDAACAQLRTLLALSPMQPVYYHAPDGRLMMRIMHCPPPPLCACPQPMLQDEPPQLSYQRIYHRQGPLPRPRPRQPPPHAQDALPLPAPRSRTLRVAGGYKCFDARGDVQSDLFYGGIDIMPTHDRAREDSLGQLASAHWPATEFTRHDRTHARLHADVRPASAPPRRRYEGVDDAEFYDPIANPAGEPLVLGARHGIEGGYSRELASPFAHVGSYSYYGYG